MLGIRVSCVIELQMTCYACTCTPFSHTFTYYSGTCWTSTFALSYGAIQLGLIDATVVLQKIDAYTGYNISSHVDPTLGAIGLALVLNETLEVVRLPFVIMTTKPVVHWLGLGPKY